MIHTTIVEVRRFTPADRLSFFGDHGEPSAMLSGGQLQRLAITRSVLRADADMIVVLDATADSFDSRQLGPVQVSRVVGVVVTVVRRAA